MLFRSRDGDKNRLRIEFDIKGFRDFKAWLVVAPDEKWVIHEYECKDFRDTYHGRIEYSEPIDGFPVPKRIRVTSSSAGLPLATNSYAFDVDQIKFGDLNERDFLLAAFGVKDPEAAKKQP